MDAISAPSFVELPGLRIHYAFSGAAGAPVVLFSNSLGTNLSLWEPQLAALQSRFRVLRYDSRGHGLTSVTPGPYSLDQLGRDALGVLDALGVAQAHFCGLSIGGLVGMWLGINARDRVGKLALCNTAARIGGAEGWNARIESVRSRGLNAIAPESLERWFTPAFRTRRPEVFAAAERMLEGTSAAGYLACCAALRDADLQDQLAAIQAPTLVVSGAHDPATPPSQGRSLAAAIPGATYLELAASHLSNLEAAAEFNLGLLRFLNA